MCSWGRAGEGARRKNAAGRGDAGAGVLGREVAGMGVVLGENIIMRRSGDGWVAKQEVRKQG